MPARLNNLEIMPSPGVIRGKEYTHADLDSICRNFQDFSTGPNPLHHPVCKWGHGEQQPEGMPAAGWVRALRRDPVTGGLHADVDSLDEEGASKIDNGHFPMRSPEFYDAPPEGIPGGRIAILAKLRQRGVDVDRALPEAREWAKRERAKQEAEYAEGRRKRRPDPEEPTLVDQRLRMHFGPMLRALAHLGADIPEQKGLKKAAPSEAYAEQTSQFAFPRALTLQFLSIRRNPEQGTWQCYSEVRSMEPEEMMEKCAERGMDPEIMKKTPPECLAEFHRLMEARDEHDNTMDDDRTDKMLSKYLEDDMPEEVDEETQTKYRERARKFGEFARKFAERVAKFGEMRTPEQQAKGELPVKMSELEALIEKRVNDKLAAHEKFSEISLTTQKKDSIDGLLDRLGREGKLAPSEREAERQELLLLDATTVHKFSEGGKDVSSTLFDRRVKRLENRSSKFASSIKGGKGSGPSSRASEDEQVKLLEEHYESYSEEFQRYGTSQEDFVEAFKLAKKKNPSHTAEQYLRQAQAG